MSSRDSLDEILSACNVVGADTTLDCAKGYPCKHMKQAIHQWALDEVIGKDDTWGGYNGEDIVNDEKNFARNQLRAEQRRKLKGDIDE